MYPTQDYSDRTDTITHVESVITQYQRGFQHSTFTNGHIIQEINNYIVDETYYRENGLNRHLFCILLKSREYTCLQHQEHFLGQAF